MNLKPIEAIAKAVLYEGYMLYPYRPSSVKNRQRFNFGVLYPKSYSEETGSDPCSLQTEVLVEGDSRTSLEVRLRFLKLIDRSTRNPAGFASQPFQQEPAAWQEATECEVVMPICNLQALAATPAQLKFDSPAREDELQERNSQNTIVRKQVSVCGSVTVTATAGNRGVFKVQVRVENLTLPDVSSKNLNRDSALLQSLVSAHVVLGVTDGEFVSILEPPDQLAESAANCQNVGVWPVLVGAEGCRDTMLASPIILYDYPQIAPESPGDLFDGTEIDEILALRIMTLTDEEKHEMRNTDERARALLERTESLPMEQWMKLHGTLRELHSVKDETP